jgi:hypothetical protein
MNASNLAKDLAKHASCPWLRGLPVSGRQTCPECGQPSKSGEEARGWKSMVADDKRTVQIIEFQPIGGLKFFRPSNCDLKPAHWDDEFASRQSIYFAQSRLHRHLAQTSSPRPSFCS